MRRAGRSVYTRLPQFNKLIKDKGLNEGGEFNQFLAEQIEYYCIDYVPYDTGQLASSPIDRGIIEEGGKSIRWSAYSEQGYNYASYQYYLQDWYPNPNYSNQNGLRGSHWDKRMMLDHKNEIMDSLKREINRKIGE